eukprot:1681836-Alexandrium_andersonii.AAC.1
MRAHPRPRLRVSADFTRGQQCCSEHHEGCRSTSAQSSTPRVALDLMDYFFTDPQIPEGYTSSDTVAEHDSDDAVFRINVL